MNSAETGHSNIFHFNIPGSSGKPITGDLRLPDSQTPVPLLIFIHGFKGFKDWGHFNAIAETICNNGIAVLKFNFSHNGTTPENLTDFADLEAFGNNTFTFELNDLGAVIDFCFEADWKNRIDGNNLFLLGHSRGGGAAILKAGTDERIKKAVTWAGVSDYESRVNPPDLEQWKTAGVVYQRNARTGQDMPLYFTLHTDFYKNQSILDIAAALKKNQKPLLLVHGTNDESVLPAEAEAMKKWYPAAQLELIEGANHTFGGSHPFSATELPAHTREAIEKTLKFLNKTV